jgi:hypothetical protein
MFFGGSTNFLRTSGSDYIGMFRAITATVEKGLANTLFFSEDQRCGARD